MEEYAFQYVQEKGYEVPTYSNAPAGGMHLSQLFNMTAGTSTGSILAAGLSIYDENNHTQPALYSDDLIEIYSTKGDQIFMSQKLSTAESVASWFVICLVFTAVFFTCGIYKYDNPKRYARIDKRLEILKEVRKDKQTPDSYNIQSKKTFNAKLVALEDDDLGENLLSKIGDNLK